MSLYDRLLPDEASPGDIVWIVGDVPWTRADVRNRVDRAVGLLVRLGLSRGDRLFLQGPKHPDWMAIHLAALRLGVATAPFNPRATSPEVAAQLDTVQPDVALLTADGLPHADGDRRLDVHEAFQALSSIPPVSTRTGDDADLALIGSTSGTTGAPKPVPLRHRHLLGTLDALQRRWSITEDDVLLHVLPLFHIHGLVVAHHTLLASGGRIVWQDGFDPAATQRAMHQHHATVFMAVPTLYRRLLEQPELTLPESLRLCTSGSAPLPVPVHEAFEARTGRRIVERYGMTEIGIVLSAAPDDAIAGSVGTPVEGVEVRVADPSGAEVQPGDVGEIRVRGRSVFEGYEGRPDATSTALVDGWMHTGDLATVDSSGRVFIRGRRSALILSGGFNVYPTEIEAALAEIPGVQEACVAGLTDDDLGEVPVATCVGSARAETVLEALRERLAAYKIPRHVAFTTSLPRNAMGKLDRSRIAAAWHTPHCRDARADDIDRLALWNRHMALETERITLDPEIAHAGVRHAFEQGRARYLVAEVGGGLPVGQLMITTEWSDWRDASIWWVQSVYVPTVWRRRGVLRALLTHVEELARQEGVPGLRLYVDRTNTRAASAYAALGWDGNHYAVFERMLED